MNIVSMPLPSPYKFHKGLNLKKREVDIEQELFTIHC